MQGAPKTGLFLIVDNLAVRFSHNFNGGEDACKLGKEYLNTSTT